MFEEFYKLSGRPFQLTPDPRFYFDARTHHKAMAYLTYGLSQEEGFIIITGEIGTGKTTLLGHLLEQLDPAEYLVSQVVSTQLNADDMLRAIARGFGLELRAPDKAGILRELEAFLREVRAGGKRALLVVDEAQNLPLAALEELRMLSNFQDRGAPLIQCFLVGQPEFRVRLFQTPALEQLRQRVIATHHLEAMGREEVKGYIEHRLGLVGWQGDPEFTDDAHDAIYEYTQGVPRRVNLLCSRILLFGALEELHRIDADVVRAVIEDLEADNVYQAREGARRLELADAPGATPEAGAVGSPAPEELAELERRLTVLEHYIRRHEALIAHVAKAAGLRELPKLEEPPPAPEPGDDVDAEPARPAGTGD